MYKIHAGIPRSTSLLRPANELPLSEEILGVSLSDQRTNCVKHRFRYVVAVALIWLLRPCCVDQIRLACTRLVFRLVQPREHIVAGLMSPSGEIF
jgi:hypothetical protein